MRLRLVSSDQFCSLVYTLSHVYFVGCVYNRNFDASWALCQDYSIASVWAVPFVMASLPLFVRFVQSIKRYADSRLVTHLINVSHAIRNHIDCR